MKIAGIWPGHDCSFCILENGIPVVHAEYERYIREKEPQGDSVQFMIDECPEFFKEINHFATCLPVRKTKQYESFSALENVLNKNNLIHYKNKYFSKDSQFHYFCK